MNLSSPDSSQIMHHKADLLNSCLLIMQQPLLFITSDRMIHLSVDKVMNE